MFKNVYIGWCFLLLFILLGSCCSYAEGSEVVKTARYIYLQNNQPLFKCNVSENSYDLFIYEGTKRISKIRIDAMGNVIKEDFVNDYQGSPVAVIAEDQSIKYQNYNDPWGNSEMEIGSPSSNPEFKYTDKELDEDSNLYYFHARYYDPIGGRFLGRDSVKVEDSLSSYFHINSYLYCYNNPLNRIDVDGKLGRVPLDKYGVSGWIFYMDVNDTVKPLVFDNGANLKNVTGPEMLVLNGTFIDQPNKHYFGAVKDDQDIFYQTDIYGHEVNNYKVEIKQRSGIAFNNDGSAMIGSWDEVLNSGYDNAMTGGLQIVKDGNIVNKPSGVTPGCHFNNPGSRFAIGINNKGKMSVIMPKNPVTGTELAKIVKKAGYKDAILFDGNSKAFLNYKGQQQTGGSYNGFNYTGFQFKEN